MCGMRSGLTHLDDVTMEAKEQVQRDLLSQQGVQTGQSWVLSPYLHHLKTFLLRSRKKGRLAEFGIEIYYIVKGLRTKY